MQKGRCTYDIHRVVAKTIQKCYWRHLVLTVYRIVS
ncbi:hypothetical protein Goarm_003659 [Gossypium armourianum]|uniref:Uncharacterized protein n=1 Tax=Gossypium armourianum TaxID=34283 RepID=A0A7J9K401_9ROSI|nr:hypothetical protein [Gossypium armourianum]